MMMSRRAFMGALGAGTIAVRGVSPVRALPSATGAPLIVTATAESTALGQALRLGDIYTFAGEYAMDPITHEKTSYLQRFMVMTEVTGDDVQCLPIPTSAYAVM